MAEAHQADLARAKRRRVAAAEVQISETETPLHRLETLYRRITENLTTEEFPPSALRPVLDPRRVAEAPVRWCHAPAGPG